MKPWTALRQWFARPLPFALLVGLAVGMALWWLLTPAPRWSAGGAWKPVCFNAEGSKLLCVEIQGKQFSDYGGLAVVATANGKLLEHHPNPYGHALWFFDPHGAVMAVKKDTVLNSHCELELIEVASGKVRGRFRPAGFVPKKPQNFTTFYLDPSWVAMAASPDGSKVVIGNFQGTNNGSPGPHELRLWDVATGTVGPPIPGQAETYRGICFSADGATFAVIGPGGEVRRYATADGTAQGPSFVLPQAPVILRCSRDGRWRFANRRWAGTPGKPDQFVEVFELGTNAAPVAFSLGTENIDTVQFSSDGERLIATTRASNMPTAPGWWRRFLAWFGFGPNAGAEPSRVLVFAADTGRLLFQREHVEHTPTFRTLPGDLSGFHALVAPDGRHIAVCRIGNDSILEWWDMEGQVLYPWLWSVIGGVVAALLVWLWRRGWLSRRRQELSVRTT